MRLQVLRSLGEGRRELRDPYLYTCRMEGYWRPYHGVGLFIGNQCWTLRGVLAESGRLAICDNLRFGCGVHCTQWNNYIYSCYVLLHAFTCCRWAINNEKAAVHLLCSQARLDSLEWAPQMASLLHISLKTESEAQFGSHIFVSIWTSCSSCAITIEHEVGNSILQARVSEKKELQKSDKSSSSIIC